MDKWTKAMQQWIANEERKQDKLAEETIMEYKLLEAKRRVANKEVAANGTN